MPEPSSPPVFWNCAHYALWQHRTRGRIGDTLPYFFLVLVLHLWVVDIGYHTTPFSDGAQTLAYPTLLTLLILGHFALFALWQGREKRPAVWLQDFFVIAWAMGWKCLGLCLPLLLALVQWLEEATLAGYGDDSALWRLALPGLLLIYYALIWWRVGQLSPPDRQKNPPAP